jgi:hypothetical protein
MARAIFDGASPVSGRGIDGLTSSVLSHTCSFANYSNATAWSLFTRMTNGFAAPVTPDGTWTALVEPNPVYAWFMASLTNHRAPL